MGPSGWEGCLGFRFNPSSPEHAYIQENDKLGKLPDYTMAQLFHSLDPVGGPGRGLSWLMSTSRVQHGPGARGELFTALAPRGLPGPLSKSSHLLQRPKGLGPEETSGRALGLASIRQSCWGLPSCSHPGAWTQLPLLASSALLHQNNF